jgi:hypothetical protein
MSNVAYLKTGIAIARFFIPRQSHRLHECHIILISYYCASDLSFNKSAIGPVLSACELLPPPPLDSMQLQIFSQKYYKYGGKKVSKSEAFIRGSSINFLQNISRGQ